MAATTPTPASAEAAPAGWPVAIAFTFVVFALVALLIVPRQTIRSAEAHRHVIEAQAEPARTHLREIRTQVGRSAAASRAYLLTGDPGFRRDFVNARSSYHQSLDGLERMTRELGPAVRASVTQLGEALHRWEARQDAILEAGAGANDLLMGENELFEVAVAETTRLAELVVAEQARQRDVIRSAERTQRTTLALLGLVTFLAAFAVSWLGWRYRRLMIGAQGERLEVERINRKLGALLWHNPEAAFELDASGVTVRANPAAERLLGLTADEFVGREFLSLVPEDVRPVVATALRQALEGDPQHHDAALICADGGRISVEITDIPIQPNGRPSGIYRVIEDVSDERRARRQLHFLAEAGRTLSGSLEYGETLANVAHLAVPEIADWCVVDVLEDGEILRVGVAHSEPAKEALAWEVARRYPQRIEGEGAVGSVLRSGDPKLVPEVSSELLRSVAHDDEHFRILTELGLRSFIVVPMVARGRILGAVTLIRAETAGRYDEEDVEFAVQLAGRAAIAVDNARLFGRAQEARGEAERRARQEAALRRAAQAMTASSTVQEVIHKIAANAHEAVNADGAFVKQVDAATDELVVVAVAGTVVPRLGSRGPFRGSYTERFIEDPEPLLLPGITDSRHPIFADVLRTCNDCAVMVLPLADGGEAIGSLVLTRLPERRGFRPDEIERARTFADLAALAFRRISLLEESEQRREELERVMESRARLIRGFSHDLKNPLGAADGYLELIESGVIAEPEKVERSLSRARRAIHSALRLIADLSELARVEAGRIEVETQAVDLRLIVREMTDEYRAQAEGKGLTIAAAIPERFPLIRSDSARIRQILGNLASNAVKYTSEGGIRLSTHVVRDGGPRPGSWAVVEVTDTGTGIPDDKRHLLFREFSRLEPESAPGLGLGLAISQRVAEALAGTILLESEVGRGSTFSLWLPCADDG
jgi:PAS domain S-box-containing protein